MPLILERRQVGAAAIVGVAGEVDSSTAAELAAALMAAAQATGAPTVVADLSETRFLDSSALGALVGVAKELPSARLVLLCPHRHLRKVLRISRLDEVIEVLDDPADLPV